MKVDRGENHEAGWLTAVEAFYVSMARGQVPLAVPVRIGDESTLATVAVPATGRVGAAVTHPDRMVRARAIAGLLLIARERVSDQLGGVIPA